MLMVFTVLILIAITPKGDELYKEALKEFIKPTAKLAK